MNATMMQEVLRITDRFMDRKDPDSIDRQGRLINVVVVVVIFHIIMGIAFVKMQEYERQHPHTIYDTNVAFELAAPPPDPTFKVTSKVPEPIALTEGENPNPGSAAAPKPKETDKVTLPTVKAPEINPLPTPETARPVVARETTVAPPVAVTKMTDVKAAPMQKPKTSPLAKPVNTDVLVLRPTPRRAVVRPRAERPMARKAAPAPLTATAQAATARAKAIRVQAPDLARPVETSLLRFQRPPQEQWAISLPTRRTCWFALPKTGNRDVNRKT